MAAHAPVTRPPTLGDIDPADDRLLNIWAGVCRQAIRDFTAPPTDRKVKPEHRQSAQAFLRKHGFLRSDGSLGRPLTD